MYLTDWMILTLIVAFGCCATINYHIGRKIGVLIGGNNMLEILEEKNIIRISEEGIVTGVAPAKQKKRKIG